MKTVWITYAWEDNKNQDIDFIAQDLVNYGVNVKLDRWNIQAGKRLWEQISNFIHNKSESDGWVFIATQNSLGSEPCKEEFAIALDRALRDRGANFPIIGLFISHVNQELIPPAISTRLYVSLTDPDWKERIRSTLENTPPNIKPSIIDPFYLKVHRGSFSGSFPGVYPICIEVRPRSGTWSPFIAAIPITERSSLNPLILHGPSDRVPNGGVLFNTKSGESNDKKWHCLFADNEATNSQSYYFFCNSLPTKFVFGVNNGKPQFTVTNFI